MSIITNDPITQLAFSVYENKGVYALLVGSGLSRAAGIPTGWEITLDLVRRVAAAQGVEDKPDWAAWHKEKTNTDPNYSDLVADLGLSRDERRSILHSYIEPNDVDREEGRKLPTKAHHAIATLVSEGYIKVVVTTNFDRLLENALREHGVEPTLIASVDALKGAEPLTHTNCYLVKLHGDYKDARILNTEEELTTYPIEYDTLLDRIIDEHGLIVCGWSGEWDHALRASLLRAPARRYPLFWAARGKLGEGAMEIAKHRDARVIEIGDADEFFTGLEQRIQTLARTHRQNPFSVDLLVNTTKRYLEKSESRIQLDELFSTETQDLVDKLDAANLNSHGQLSPEEFARRIALYESITEPLARMAGVLGRWGNGSEQLLALDIIRRLCAHADRETAGLTVYLAIRTYPAVLFLTAYGLGLVRGERWADLHELLIAQIEYRNRSEPSIVAQRLFLTSWPGGRDDYWRNMEDLKRHRTPLSDHLCTILSEWSASFVGVLPDFERLYETWEILGGLAYLGSVECEAIESQNVEQRPRELVWFPVGRSVWNEETRERILNNLLSHGMKPNLLEAGFCKGDDGFLQKSVDNYRHMAARMRF